ncbi:MAG: amidohydrolase family protein [Gemmatimonadales bacterium]
MSSAPVEQGAVLVDEDGRIVAAGPQSAVPAPRGTAHADYREAILVPGVINCHTHLELSSLRGGSSRTEDFFEWIRWVRSSKEATEYDAFLEAAREGLREAWRAGTTMVADAGTTGATVSALSELGGRGIYYQEAIAAEPDRAAQAMAEVRETIRGLRNMAAPGVTVGVSPHAPYTVSPELYRRVIAWAREEEVPLAAHVAESRAEMELLTEGAGPFALVWRERGIAAPEIARSPVEYVYRLGLLGPDLLAIHLAQADERDIELIARTGTAVACCPRSNARHGHGAPPLASFLGAGLRVGLGTDSLASVDSLDLFAEARAATSLCDAGPERLMRMLTAEAAWALGMQDTVGTIEHGKWADLCVVRPDSLSAADASSVARAVLAAGAKGVIATYVGGRLVHYCS